VAATVEICDLLGELEENDLAFVLLTGGGSALLDAYSEGIALDDAQMTNNILLGSGAPIQEINTVRKHISRVKGGQLARHAMPARVVTLVLSDVIGDPLSIIASGPTVPDPSTYGEALEVLEKRNALDKVPGVVKEHLEKGASGEIEETPKEGEPEWERCRTLLIGNIERAIREAEIRADQLGFNTKVLTSTMEGEARNIGKMMASLLIENSITEELAKNPFCLIAGGETTVTIEGESGKGGRSQELAHAAAVALQEFDNVALLAAGTDGTDGPTDAAGAVVDGKTVERARIQSLDPLDSLSRHDSYNFHKSTGSLIRTGPTMTNVMDIVLLLSDPGQRQVPDG
jgi:hydroxypyruvate reductase